MPTYLGIDGGIGRSYTVPTAKAANLSRMALDGSMVRYARSYDKTSRNVGGAVQSQGATVAGTVNRFATGGRTVSGAVQALAPVLNGSVENKFLSGAVSAQNASVSGTITLYPLTGWSLVDFTVNYAGLNANSPFAGDITYANLVAGDKCHFETLTDPDGHTMTMAGDGEFNISPSALTQNQTFDFQIYDISDGSFGTTGTITVEPFVPDVSLTGGVQAGSASVSGALDIFVTHTLFGGVAADNATVSGTVNKDTVEFVLGNATAQNATVSGAIEFDRQVSGAVIAQAATMSGALNKAVQIGVFGDKVFAQAPVISGSMFVGAGPPVVVDPARRVISKKALKRKITVKSLNRN